MLSFLAINSITFSSPRANISGASKLVLDWITLKIIMILETYAAFSTTFLFKSDWRAAYSYTLVALLSNSSFKRTYSTNSFSSPNFPWYEDSLSP